MTTLAKFTEWHWTAPGRISTNPVELMRGQWFKIGFWLMLDHYADAIDRMISVEG